MNHIKQKRFFLLFSIIVALAIIISLRKHPKGDETLVILHSFPANADVIIDGSYKGKTPMVIKIPNGKKLKLKLKHDGYFEEIREIDSESYHNGDFIKLIPLKAPEKKN